MAQTYAEFKEYLRTFLWKTGDTVLLSSLDQLIVLAETELNRKLDVNGRESTIAWTITYDDTNVVTLPEDAQHIIALVSQDYEYSRVSSSQIGVELAANSANRERPFYTIVGRDVQFGHVFKSTGNLEFPKYTLTYRRKYLPFKPVTGDGYSELEDLYLDLFTYTVLKHTAPWLREDERVALWSSLAQDALNSVVEEDKFNIEFGGSPTKMNMPRSPTPRRGGRPLYSR